MSANKLLNRIVIPENVDYERESNAIASDLHDYTYGMYVKACRSGLNPVVACRCYSHTYSVFLNLCRTSDSLTQFAIVSINRVESSLLVPLCH